MTRVERARIENARGWFEAAGDFLAELLFTFLWWAADTGWWLLTGDRPPADTSRHSTGGEQVPPRREDWSPLPEWVRRALAPTFYGAEPAP